MQKRKRLLKRLLLLDGLKLRFGADQTSQMLMI